MIFLHILCELTMGEHFLNAQILSIKAYTSINADKDFSLPINTPHNKNLWLDQSVQNVVGLYFQHDEDLCMYFMADVHNAVLSNVVYNFQVAVDVPASCRKVYVAPFQTLSGKLDNVSFTGIIKFKNV